MLVCLNDHMCGASCDVYMYYIELILLGPFRLIQADDFFNILPLYSSLYVHCALMYVAFTTLEILLVVNLFTVQKLIHVSAPM